jgi:hypothetical protein
VPFLPLNRPARPFAHPVVVLSLSGARPLLRRQPLKKASCRRARRAAMQAAVFRMARALPALR